VFVIALMARPLCGFAQDTQDFFDPSPCHSISSSYTLFSRMGDRIMRNIFLLVFLSCCSLLSAQSPSPQVKPFIKIDAPVVALTHVRVIDGTGTAAHEDQTIILNKGKIESVGDASSANVPKDALVLDLHGYSVIPGLVGMHEHMFYPVGPGAFGEMAYSFPRLYLAGGVTTIRTTGSLEPYTDLEIRRAINAGTIPGPKIHVTGPYLEGAGSLALQLHQLSGPEDATRTVNYWLDEGVDDFKAYMFITHDELAAAIRAAHKRGSKVTGHLCTIGFREAAALGIDGLEHGLMVDSEFTPGRKPGECKDEEDPVLMSKLDVNSGSVHKMILDLIARHVAVTSTLPVFEMGSFAGRPPLQQRILDALCSDARTLLLERWVRSSDAAATKKRYGTDTSPWPAAFRKEEEFEYAFSKAGGLLLAGLDPTGMGGVIAGFGDQREVELLVEAGFTPLEAIHIATYNGAQYLGELDRIGTIAPGKQADMVVIKGDPSKKIEDIENVETVFKDGIGYDSAKLIESVRGRVGLE
jgi:imidazolonepropionase-like amidohydrolase